MLLATAGDGVRNGVPDYLSHSESGVAAAGGSDPEHYQQLNYRHQDHHSKADPTQYVLSDSSLLLLQL